MVEIDAPRVLGRAASNGHPRVEGLERRSNSRSTARLRSNSHPCRPRRTDHSWRGSVPWPSRGIVIERSPPPSHPDVVVHHTMTEQPTLGGIPEWITRPASFEVSHRPRCAHPNCSHEARAHIGSWCHDAAPSTAWLRSGMFPEDQQLIEELLRSFPLCSCASRAMRVAPPSGNGGRATCHDPSADSRHSGSDGRLRGPEKGMPASVVVQRWYPWEARVLRRRKGRFGTIEARMHPILHAARIDALDAQIEMLTARKWEMQAPCVARRRRSRRRIPNLNGRSKLRPKTGRGRMQCASTWMTVV